MLLSSFLVLFLLVFCDGKRRPAQLNVFLEAKEVSRFLYGMFCWFLCTIIVNWIWLFMCFWGFVLSVGRVFFHKSNHQKSEPSLQAIWGRFYERSAVNLKFVSTMPRQWECLDQVHLSKILQFLGSPDLIFHLVNFQQQTKSLQIVTSF